MFGVLVPRTRISADVLDSVEQLRQCDTLDIAYFDEDIQVVVYTPSSVAQVEVDLVYNLQNTARIVLDSKVVIGSEAVWLLDTIVVPDKLSNQLQIKASFRQQSKKIENLESHDTVTIGSTVLTKHVDLYELVKAETSLRISPVFQMRFKTIKTEKTMASLEVALSGQLRASAVTVRIESVDMDIRNCLCAGYSVIKYPLVLQNHSILSLTYRLTNNDIKWVKPVSVTIHCTVNGNRKIVTRWTTNVDFMAAPSVPPMASPNLGLVGDAQPLQEKPQHFSFWPDESQARRGVQMEAPVYQQVERLALAHFVHSIIHQQTVRKVSAADADPERQQVRSRPAVRAQPAGASFPARVQQGGADFSHQQPEIHSGPRKSVRDRARAYKHRKGAGQPPRCQSVGDQKRGDL
ncbi:hypothetical protein KL930_004748 [Ogataea haglerorum]|uniref:Uncharacterized protein n=1 Tax=Ogataea haglerorum TaxID=1937702 RepID=A0AAN6D323_9ASCO|nr:uncharacterized protein KL911_004479 [Ogataea haglerorum]KAG7693167.1 hypothetical protein KL951_004706 [Ogataea haglerorum]KAG7724823.1 hypothetical protein KL933_004645 [Ogataea haglerorum]KAG7745909.1 hypothetical protein KL912_004765 [Ogataea haglerorum]KAG7751605.1 hypothetical protein KL911_004479 [Ogataea haglerorum]KAG7772965.1 hypothetical protein KL930_004748 [Ogataea haglerorum]